MEKKKGREAVEVTEEMVEAALVAISPYLEGGTLGCCDSRQAVRAVLICAFQEFREGKVETATSLD
jgi:hypothetical protein